MARSRPSIRMHLRTQHRINICTGAVGLPFFLSFFPFYPACSVWMREGNILAVVHKRTLSSVSLGFAHAYLKMTQAKTRARQHALQRTKRGRWRERAMEERTLFLSLTLTRTAVIYQKPQPSCDVLVPVADAGT